jgi:hypothetical protein
MRTNAVLTIYNAKKFSGKTRVPRGLGTGGGDSPRWDGPGIMIKRNVLLKVTTKCLIGVAVR